MCVSVFGLTSCQNEMDNLGGKEVTLRVTANRGEAATRTTLAPDGEGNLACTWDNGDQLLVVKNSDGSKLGVITLVSGADSDEGVFEGKVNLDGHDAVFLVYLGKAGNAETYADKNLALNVSAQDGTLASLTSKDVLAAEAAIKDGDYVSYDRVETRVEMIRQLAHGYFELNFGDGVELEVGDEITITGEGLRSEGKVNFKNGGNVPTITNYTGSTTITVTKKEAGNDFYLTMLPVGNVTPTFTVEKDGVTYTAELGVHKWVSGEFVRGAANSTNETGFDPVSVSMEKVADDVDPTNPGNFDNWGASYDAIPEVATPLSPKFVSEDGWTNNIRNLYNMGGYCTAVEIQNGMMNGLLTSKGGNCYFFQWGRFLGFPSNVAGSSLTIPGADRLAPLVGYLDESGVPVRYTVASMGNSSAFNKQRALDWSIVYGMTSNNRYLDYIYGNGSCSNWYDRSPNPAPTGYRIPTMDELSFFIPSTEKVNGSYAEVKPVNGVKYAVKWTVGKVGTLGCVDITSVKTSESKVTVNSSIFNSQSAKTIKIVAYGYMQDDGTHDQAGVIGLYWSSDSGKEDAIDTGGKGGRALYVEVNGNTAFLCEMCAPFGFGGNVMLIKDPTAVASKIKPWLPYSYDNTAIR